MAPVKLSAEQTIKAATSERVRRIALEAFNAEPSIGFQRGFDAALVAAITAIFSTEGRD